MSNRRKEKGFTIIEVVLVLAIAGLIFMMVFVALPALQRSQRDTQRKSDLSRAITSVASYASNNRNALPASNSAAWNAFAASYLRSNNDTFTDPSGTDYTFIVGGTVSNSFDAASPNIIVTIGATCNGETLTTGQGTRKVALQMKLEGGGISCQNN